MVERTASPWWRGLLAHADALDVAAYQAVARTGSPALDGPLRLLSTAANHSKISMGVAVVLAATGGQRGRRAAVAGLASVAVASSTANLGGKLAVRRRRPDRATLGVAAGRHVHMPTSASFPSGHTASAFAFASGVGHVWPEPAVPLVGLACVVAYSRVHTGVHYPGDVLGGALWGLASAALATRALHRLA